MANWQSVDEKRMDFIVDVTLEHGIVNTPTLVSLHQLRLYDDPHPAQSDSNLELLPDFYTDVVWHPERGIPVYRGLPREFFEKRADSFAKKKTLLLKLHEAGAARRQLVVACPPTG